MLPNLIHVRQHAPAERVEDPAAEVKRALRSISLSSHDLAGKRVALTAGSRGIANIAAILGAIAEEVKRAGGEPVVIGAMGSHGGGAPSGQLDVLHGIGITADAVGAEVRATPETELLGHTARAIPIYCNVEALAADAKVTVTADDLAWVENNLRQERSEREAARGHLKHAGNAASA